MIVLKAPTIALKTSIEGKTSHPHLIRFIKDANGNYIVGKQILTDPKFEYLRSEFKYLEEIEYKPIVEDEP